MTRLLHISDTHGRLPTLIGNFDVVVHSGDMSPNFSRDSTETQKEMYWWEENVERVKEWLQGTPFLFTLGNHDFLNGFWLEGMFRSHGIEAYCLHDRIVSLNNVNFYGFPYVPPINGSYNFECYADEMDEHLRKMSAAINKTYVDVLVAHCPPYNCLDLSESGKHYGNTQLGTLLDYQTQRDMMPGYLLCGHIHAAHGITIRNGLLVSNAATVQQILEI